MGSKVIQLVSAWPESELRPSNSRASDPKTCSVSALSSEHAKLLAMTEWSVFVTCAISWAFCMCNPSTEHQVLCRRSSGLLHAIQMFVAHLGNNFFPFVTGWLEWKWEASLANDCPGDQEMTDRTIQRCSHLKALHSIWATKLEREDFWGKAGIKG